VAGKANFSEDFGESEIRIPFSIKAAVNRRAWRSVIFSISGISPLNVL